MHRAVHEKVSESTIASVSRARVSGEDHVPVWCAVAVSTRHQRGVHLEEIVRDRGMNTWRPWAGAPDSVSS
jgi:hypothetical protein